MANINESSGSTTQPLKRNSDDVGWEYGILVDEKKLDKIKCILCGKQMSGGIHRLKEHVGHVSGNVSKCPKATQEDKDKCRNAVMEVKQRKKIKLIEESTMRGEVTIGRDNELGLDEEVEIGGGRKEPHHLGPIDKYARGINSNSSLYTSKTRQQNINETLFKERTKQVHGYLSAWVYESNISFNAVQSDAFKCFVEAVGQFGPGYKPASIYELGEPLLKDRVDKTKLLLKRQEEEWDKNGCSIMTDAWTDRKRRSIMNLVVNCREGTMFLSSKESSTESHTAEYIFEYVEKGIEQVGAARVVQVVTDNAANNMAAARIMREKRPNIFWSSCAAHSINLMLESISKLPRFQKPIEQAKSLTIFIYAHYKTLTMMRSFTKKRDIIRPGVTRFASSFLTLQNLMEKKSALKTMFSSDDWEKCKFSRTTKGKAAYSIVMSLGFWNGMTGCLKVFGPLVKVLRLVDGDRRPAMPWLYGELMEAKQQIKEVLNNNENNYRSIIEIIEARMKDRLDSSLHKAAFLLNRYYHYKDPRIGEDNDLNRALIDCVDVFHRDDIVMQEQIVMTEAPNYMRKLGEFGKPLAIRSCEKDSMDPVQWWNMFGGQTPHLQKISKRILALTTSSSGCERNWSSFEGIHTKKRNRLDTTRLNNLVYVHFNSKLMNKKIRDSEKNVDVLLATDGDDSTAHGWLVRGGDEDDDEVEAGTGQSRELHDDDFDEENEQVMDDIYGDEGLNHLNATFTSV